MFGLGPVPAVTASALASAAPITSTTPVRRWAPTLLEILQQRFARGEIDTAEFEEKRRLLTNA